MAASGAEAALLVDVSDLPVGHTRRLEAEGRELLLCHTPEGFFAVADRCTHMAFSLSGGRLEGCLLECPLHGARFDVRDGSVRARPAHRPLATFPVRVSGARAEIRLDRSTSA
jgi:nitrite reductase/ring-hydroxylating ferredoxin subunit